MDIFGVLTGIKDKVLDAAHFELLRTAYELQNQNIDQLKNNNAAITEHNKLLRDRCDKLEEEIGQLKAENASLRAHQTQVATVKPDYQPTGIPLEILQLYRRVDKTVLFDEQIAPVLKHSKLEIQVAFSELSDAGILSLGILGGRGAGYFLTTPGKKFVLQIDP